MAIHTALCSEAPNKRPRTGRGLSVSEGKEDLVPPAAEVEAVDQLAADGLHVFFRILGSNESAWRCCKHAGEERILGTVARVAILRFPVQARDEVEAVFVAGADEPAPIGLAGEREASRGVVHEVRERNALEPGLRVAAGHIGQ